MTTHETYRKAGERIVTGEEYAIHFGDLGTAYNDTWFGSKKILCRCLGRYAHGALFTVKGVRSTATCFLNWWEIYQAVA